MASPPQSHILITYDWFSFSYRISKQNYLFTLKFVANIWEDVSGKRIKCTDFEGFTPIS
jgi:hypothetical protein